MESKRPSTSHVRYRTLSLSALRRPRTATHAGCEASQLPSPFDETTPDLPGLDTITQTGCPLHRGHHHSHEQQGSVAWPPPRRKSTLGLNRMLEAPPVPSRGIDKRPGASRLSGLFKHKSRESLSDLAYSRIPPGIPLAKSSSSPNWLKRAANATFRGRRQSNLTDIQGASGWVGLETPDRLSSASPPTAVPLRLRGGDAARAAAAAAASNDRLETTVTPPSSQEVGRVRDVKSSDDNESGIGIEVQDGPITPFEDPPGFMSRLDPASLPEELFHHILNFLDAPSLMAAELVSRRWQVTAGSRTIWRDTFRAEYQHRAATLNDSVNFVGGRGIGTDRHDQEWKQMLKVRQALDARWRNGQAAAIYLEGHGDSVYCVQFDEDKIVTGSRDRTIRVWDARTFACRRVLGVPKSSTAPATVPSSIGGRMLRQKPLISLTLPTSACVSPMPRRGALNHHGSILCLQFDATMMVTGSSDASLLVWDLTQDYVPVRRLCRHRAGVLDVCFDARHVVSCSKDTTICVWDRATGSLLNCLKGHLGPVNAVQLRGDHFVSASGDGLAKLWHLASGLCVKEFPSKVRGLACVEFSPDSRTILAGGNDQVIYQFDANTGELVRELTGHGNLVRSLHLDAANGRVVSGSYDYSVKVFDLSLGGKMVCDFVGWTTSWILSAVADYRRIVATSQDGRVVVMDFGHGLEGVELLEGIPSSASDAKDTSDQTSGAERLGCNDFITYEGKQPQVKSTDLGTTTGSATNAADAANAASETFCTNEEPAEPDTETAQNTSSGWFV